MSNTLEVEEEEEVYSDFDKTLRRAQLLKDMFINFLFHPGRHRQLGDQLSQQSNPIWTCWGGDA